jgi:hypothetical protein
MPAYLYNAPAGVVGDITRTDESSVEPAMLIAVSSVYAQAYGIPVAYASGGVSQWQGSNVAADFAGVLARTAPEISGNLNSGFTDTTPNPLQPQNLLVRGYVSVLCKVGTPARGGVVYIRTVVSGSKAIGDFEATSDPGNNVALSSTQATWASDGMDADLNAELRVYR